MLTAKLFVPRGAPVQRSSGDTFLPVQSQPLNTCSSAIRPPCRMSGLVKVSELAAPALATPPTISAVQKAIVRMRFVPPKASDRDVAPRGLSAHPYSASDRDDASAAGYCPRLGRSSPFSLAQSIALS